MKDFIKGSAKAVVAGAVAGLSTAVGFADDGFTTSEWLGIVLAALVGFNGTYWVTNSGPKAPVPDNVKPDPEEDAGRLF